MDLAACMDELGTALETIDGLRVFPYWAKSVVPPAAVVGWPDPLDYDAAYGRGGDRVNDVPVIVMVGAADTRTARDALSAYVNGSGPRSVKVAIDDHVATAYDSARVKSVSFGFIAVAAVEYLAATFLVDIIGKGA